MHADIGTVGKGAVVTMEIFWQDLRYSLRTLFKRPGFTFVVVTTLALGIGANATIFTWIKAVLLASLPGIEQPEKLVEIWGATRHNSAFSSSYVDYLDYRDQNKVLSGLIAHQVLPLNLGRSEKPERVWGAIVSGNYFDVLGVRPLIGRTFLPEEDRTPNTHPVVVIGHGLWERRFGADPNHLPPLEVLLGSLGIDRRICGTVRRRRREKPTLLRTA